MGHNGPCLCLPLQRLIAGRSLPPKAETPAKVAGARQPRNGDSGAASMKRAMAEFRDLGAKATAQAPADAQIWTAACDMIFALLEGVCRHLPSVDVVVEVTPPGVGDTASTGSTGSVSGPALPRMAVSLSPAPLTGEFATKSRLATYLCLAEELRFEPRWGTTPRGRGMLLQVQGISLKPYEGADRMRASVLRELGEDASPAKAFEWWVRIRDEVCPKETSKIRWFVESLLEKPYTAQVLSQRHKANLVLGLAHARLKRIEHFALVWEGRDGVRISATQSEPSDEEGRLLDACTNRIAIESLLRDRTMAEVFAPSTINWTAMLLAHGIGQMGAHSHKIVKLLSGASHWGAGTSGWQRFDDTWLCEDRKDAFGRVVQEQGRLVWRLPSGAAGDAARSVPVSSAAWQEAKLRTAAGQWQADAWALPHRLRDRRFLCKAVCAALLIIGVAAVSSRYFPARS